MASKRTDLTAPEPKDGSTQCYTCGALTPIGLTHSCPTGGRTESSWQSVGLPPMTDLTPEQRAVDVLFPFTHIESGITWVTNPSYEKLRDAIATEVRAAEQAAREKATKELREVLQAAVDWDAEYRAINNLGSKGPHWVNWAKESLGMAGHYEAKRLLGGKE